MADDKQRVNPRYAFEQLMRALGSGGEAAGRHASQWRRVLTGMFEGTLSIGSRTPVSDTPAWVTLEVAHGGFATGRYLAGGPLQEHELSKLGLIDRPAGVSERAALNAYYLGDAGRAELQKALSTGRFRLQVPEESALAMVVGWLVGHNESAHADELLADISGFFGELRFYPAPHPRPSRLTTDVYLEPAQTTVERLRSVKPSAPVAAMKEAIKIWTPLYDRTVAIFLETVEGETPFLVTDKSGELTRRPDGNPIVAGGWPCRHYPDGWRTRAGELLEAYEGARSNHRLSRKPERAKENFARLRSYLAVCIKDAASLSGRDVGMIRKILASDPSSRPRGARKRPARSHPEELRSRTRPSLNTTQSLSCLLAAWRHPSTTRVCPMLTSSSSFRRLGSRVSDRRAGPRSDPAISASQGYPVPGGVGRRVGGAKHHHVQ